MDIEVARQEVRDDFERHGIFVGQHAFYQCHDTMWQWIDTGSLTGQLMKHGLVTDPSMLYYITNHSIPPREKVSNLLTKVAPQAGSYGFHLLYVCIRDARDNLGHQDAADLLKQHGVSDLPAFNLTSPVPVVPLLAQPPRAPQVSSGEDSMQSSSTTTTESVGRRVTKYKTKTTTSETYVCEGGASGMGHPDVQVLSKPIQETGDDHTSVYDDVEEDRYVKREGSAQYHMQSAEDNVNRVHAGVTGSDSEEKPSTIRQTSKVKLPRYSIEEGNAILSDHKHRLSQPNTVSIDIGWKVVGGKKTNRRALIVGVIKKKPSDQVTDKELLPSEVTGIVKTSSGAEVKYEFETDVVEEGIIKDSSGGVAGALKLSRDYLALSYLPELIQ